MLTLAVTVSGFFLEFIQQLLQGELPGGGPLEAAVRLAAQKNPVVKLEPGFYVTLVEMLDVVFKAVIVFVRHIVPDFGSYSYSVMVAKGFNIDATTLGLSVIGAFAYIIPVVLIGHIFLKERQVAE